jgi:hypothetical protein
VVSLTELAIPRNLLRQFHDRARRGGTARN